MPGVASLLPLTVHAAAEEAAAPFRLDELSLYTAPPRPKPCAEPEPGRLEDGVALLRHTLKPYADRCQVTYDRVKPRAQRIVRFGADTYAFLRSPPKDFYPRAGVIGFSGVLGLFLARGSRVKGLVYPAGLMAVCASLYYPGQAVAVAKSTGESVYDRAVRGYAALERMARPSRKGDEASDSGTKP